MTPAADIGLVWLPSLIRALATGLLVVAASAVAESLGPFWGALIASLPVSAGPAYVFLATQHGADFVAASALSSFAANAATGLFLIVYGYLALEEPDRLRLTRSAGRPRVNQSLKQMFSGRFTSEAVARRASTSGDRALSASPWRSMGIAVLTWLAASVAMHQHNWSPSSALVLNLIVYGFGFVRLDAGGGGGPALPHAARRRRFDLPIRAVVVGSFVSLLVAFSSMLGPDATGIAAVFPVSLISLIVIVRPRIGARASSLLAANALRAMLGFGLMLLTLHLAVRPWGTAAGFGAALLVSVAWSAALLLLRGRPKLSERIPRGPSGPEA